jgi:hypothetical protein
MCDQDPENGTLSHMPFASISLWSENGIFSVAEVFRYDRSSVGTRRNFAKLLLL